MDKQTKKGEKAIKKLQTCISDKTCSDLVTNKGLAQLPDSMIIFHHLMK